jgi:hypothetical protein
LTGSSRGDDPGPFSCMVCIATYLQMSVKAKEIIPENLQEGASGEKQ